MPSKTKENEALEKEILELLPMHVGELVIATGASKNTIHIRLQYLHANEMVGKKRGRPVVYFRKQDVMDILTRKW